MGVRFDVNSTHYLILSYNIPSKKLRAIIGINGVETIRDIANFN